MSGIERIAAERQRQIEQEGWTPEHDDGHDQGELALAACCYATPILLYQRIDNATGFELVDPWPWEPRWDKRSDAADHDGNTIPDPENYNYESRLDLLAKAGALIAAEIDRLERIR